MDRTAPPKGPARGSAQSDMSEKDEPHAITPAPDPAQGDAVPVRASEGASDGAGAPPARRRRRGLRTVFWMLGVVVVLSVAVVITGLALTGRPLTAPDWVTDRAEARLNAQLGETGRVDLGQIVLLVDRRGIPRITLRDVSFYDARGAEVARLNNVGAALSLAALRERRLQPDVLRLSGAQAVIRRRADGQFDLSFSGGGESSTGNLATALAEIDRAFSRVPLQGIRQLTASDLTLTLEDARSHRLWQVTGGGLEIKNTAETIELIMEFDVFNGTEELASTRITFTKRKGTAAARFAATFENAAAADIAAQTPVMAFLGVLDAPISGALRGDITAQGGLGALSGSFEVGEGALQPVPGVTPIAFEGGRAYFSFDPRTEKLQFSELSVRTEAASVKASGRAYLRDYVDGFPTAMLGQFSLSDMKLASNGIFQDDLSIAAGAVDFRLRLDPFTLDVGQVMLRDRGQRLLGDGQVQALPDGWKVRADLSMAQAGLPRVLSVWPLGLVSKTRDWFVQSVAAGQFEDITASLRVSPGEKPVTAVSWTIRDADVEFIKGFAPVTGATGYGTVMEDALTLVIEQGIVTPPQGGPVSAAGTVVRIPDITAKPARMEVDLRTDSTITAALSMLNAPPFGILKSTELPVDVALGRAQIAADIGFGLRSPITLEDVDYAVNGTLRNVVSTQLAAPRRLSADSLRVTATRDSVEIGGLARLGQAQGEGSWQQLMGADNRGKSQISGVATLDQAFLDEFGIGLPRGSVTGAGRGQFTLDLAGGRAPAFTLTSDLNALGLRLDALGWSKPRNGKGRLEVAGRLGPRPEISALSFEARGLSASDGKVSLRSDGRLEVASFQRVRVGDWLDGPVRLTGRGDQPPAVAVTGGRIDVRKTSFGQSGSRSSGASSSGPITLALDRLIVSEGIALRPFKGSFTQRGGFQGDFTAQVNGGTSIKGALAPSSNGPVIRITAADGGRTMRDASVFTTARGGALELVLTPLRASGTYDGALKLTNTRVVGAPAMTELLSAISVVGLLDQLSGPGINFTEVEAKFRLNPRQVTLLSSSATGPSLGVSLDGIYDLASARMDMQGVISPVYFLNGLGQIFTRKGEGLLGFNFNMRGSPTDPQVQVNPLSILTPGMFREIFRRPPPTVPTEE